MERTRRRMEMTEGARTFGVLLADDEEDTLLEIRDILAKDPRLRIAGAFTDPVKALEQAGSMEIDCAFIDIKMPVIDGFELGEQLMQIHPGLLIVYVTAYNDYAAEAFEINAVDYILKPVRENRLCQAVEKLIAKGPSSRSIDPPISSCRVLCFERLELYKDQIPLQWPTKKSMELFAYLLYHNGNFVSKERVADDLWPEYENAMINLHTTVYRTRRTLACLSKQINIEYKNHSYRLQMQDVYYDVGAFETAYAQSGLLSDQRIPLLQKARQIYRGDYLEETSYIWCIGLQEKLRRNYIACLKSLASFYLSNREPDSAVALLETVIDKNPYDYTAYDLLFHAYRLQKDVCSMLLFYKKASQKSYGTSERDVFPLIKKLFLRSYQDMTGRAFK